MHTDAIHTDGDRGLGVPKHEAATDGLRRCSDAEDDGFQRGRWPCGSERARAGACSAEGGRSCRAAASHDQLQRAAVRYEPLGGQCCPGPRSVDDVIGVRMVVVPIVIVDRDLVVVLRNCMMVKDDVCIPLQRCQRDVMRPVGQGEDRQRPRHLDREPESHDQDGDRSLRPPHDDVHMLGADHGQTCPRMERESRPSRSAGRRCSAVEPALELLACRVRQRIALPGQRPPNHARRPGHSSIRTAASSEAAPRQWR